jgi:predicted DNA binding CopG/RHH family protein
MNNNDDIVYCEELGIDADLKSLLDIEGVSILVLRCFGLWRRGFSEESIAEFFKITVADATAYIERIKRLVPAKRLALDIEDRNTILAYKAREQETDRSLANDLSLSANELLVRGIDPVSVLKRYRMEIAAENSSPISTLRKKDLEIGYVHEKTAENELQETRQLVTALRERDSKPAKVIMTENHVRREPDPTPIQQNEPTKFDIGQKCRSKKTAKTDRRVTVRLDPDLFEKVHRHCNDLGMDLSTAVRMALAQFLVSDASKEKAIATMPAEALARIGRYQVAGSDLKENLRESFLQLLAMSCVTEKRWPRAMWVKELYRALLPLYRILEGEHVRQN